MDSIILILFGLTIVSALVITLITVVRSGRWGRGSGSDQATRTAEEKARDKQTAVIWGCLAAAVPAVLALAYTLTR